MSRDQKIRFDDLEKLGELGEDKKTYSEEELISILSNKGMIKAVYAENGIGFLRILFEKLSTSRKFRTKALEILKQNKPL